MEGERFDGLMKQAREQAHARAAWGTYNEEIDVHRHYRATILVLERECTSDQWAKVLEAVEQGWP